MPDRPDTTTGRQRWTASQKHTLVAGVGAWTLDAFDYFILVFVINHVQAAFSLSDQTIALALTLTLLLRPVGAAIFGPLAERFGRKPVLITNIVIFAAIELLTAVSPNYAVFLTLRGVYGVAMGGVWGVSSALTLETVPPRSRGVVSGVFQAGYPGGYLIASLVNLLLGPVIGWRGMFAVGAVPLLMAGYIAVFVHESPVWLAHRNDIAATGAPRADGAAVEEGRLARLWRLTRSNWRIVVFGLVLMSVFNYFSHGTQDLYPSKFLGIQHHLEGQTAASMIPVFYTVAGIIGCVVGGALSEHFGRKRMIIIFTACVLPFIPLWAGSRTIPLLTLGACLVQFCMQAAWGIVPTYLNEIFPEGTRAALPGTIHQIGNVIASPNANLQVAVAAALGTAAAPKYGAAMAVVTGCVAVLLILIVPFGPETRGRKLG